MWILKRWGGEGHFVWERLKAGKDHCVLEEERRLVKGRELEELVANRVSQVGQISEGHDLIKRTSSIL